MLDCDCDFGNYVFAAETLSKFGSGLFLLVQVVLLLDFVHAWNENWVSKDEQFWCVNSSFFYQVFVVRYRL